MWLRQGLSRRWTEIKRAALLDLSMGCSRKEYWSGLLCPPPGDVPNTGIEPTPFTSTCFGRWVLYRWPHLRSPNDGVLHVIPSRLHGAFSYSPVFFIDHICSGRSSLLFSCVPSILRRTCSKTAFLQYPTGK